MFGKEALLQGTRSYIGIEASRAIVDTALAMLTNTLGKVHHERLETWKAQSEQADLIASRLALQYVENLEPVFRAAYQAFRPGRRMIFSVEHPVITSNFASLVEGGRTTWLVDDYFKPGARVHQWLGHEVAKYHRTLEEYFDLITMTGFKLERIRESRPQPQNFSRQEEYERRMSIPLFLFISARKSIRSSPARDRT